MRFAKVAQLGLAVALGAMACNPGDFDSALDKAPVVSFGNGSEGNSLVVLPLSPPGGGASARMLVSRKDDASYLALADYDKDGKVTVRKATNTEIGNLGGAPVVSMAALNSAQPQVQDGPIMLGTPKGGGGQQPPGRVDLLTLTTPAAGTASFAIQAGLAWQNNFGSAVAAGRVTDLSGPSEFVAISDDGVQLLTADGQTAIASTMCQNVGLAADPNLDYRPMVVGDFLPGGGEEIALSGWGHIVFVQYDVTSHSLVCSLLVIGQGVSTTFGASLAAVDFDGDGHLDLAVGMPPDHVYVYFGPFLGTDGTKLENVAIVSKTGTHFGQRVAAYRAPGQVGSQLLVSDPTASGGIQPGVGRPGGGKVMLFNVLRAGGPVQYVEDPATPNPSVEVAALFDSNTDAPTGVFGHNLGFLVFDNATACAAGGSQVLVPWATSGSSVLAFFDYAVTLGGASTFAPDPRCFAK